MIKPFGSFYLLRPLDGIVPILGYLQRGTVIVVGDDVVSNGDVGDTFYFRECLPIKDPDTGESLVLVHYDDIVAYIEAANETKEVDEPAEIPAFGGFTDWIPWSGGTCPVDSDALVAIILRDDVNNTVEDIMPAEPAGFYDWTVDGDNDGDIMFYRIV